MRQHSGEAHYLKSAEVRRSFLYNVRGPDLTSGTGIKKGQIVQGVHGFVVAQSDVPGKSGTIVNYEPNGVCLWPAPKTKRDMAFAMRCMYLPGRVKRKNYPCQNYAVAEVVDASVRNLATESSFPLVQTGGRVLMNVEFDAFAKQTKKRRADLFVDPNAIP